MRVIPESTMTENVGRGSRKTIRGSLQRVLAAAAIAFVACTTTSHATTLYSLQLYAITTVDANSAGDFNYPFTQTFVSQSAYASYDAPAPPVIGGCCGGSYAISGSVSEAHGGTVRVSASGDGAFVGTTSPYSPTEDSPNGQVFGFGKVTSNFMLAGPTATTPVPVYLDWAISATSSGAGSAYANLLLYGGCDACTYPVFEQTASSSPFGGTAVQQASAVTLVYLIPNQNYIMISTARAADSSSSYNEVPARFGTGSAFVDPLFTVSAAYANAYQLVGLPTATAVDPPRTSVPEPPMALLMSVGFGALGLIRKRRTVDRAIGIPA